MNYRHAYHAGNFADVVKHLALVAAIAHLKKKETPFAVIDTHGGRGLYDLEGEEASKTSEAQSGILRLAQLRNLPPLVGDYLKLAGAFGAQRYPGSPLIAAQMLRPQDRLTAIEKHDEEARTLTRVLAPYSRAHAVEADGYERLAALLPPAERRGLVLIDPPYEATDEFARAEQALGQAHRRFATGIYLLWFPIKSQSAADSFCGEILTAGMAKVLRIDIDIGAPPGDDKERLHAAGLLIVNPPFGFDTEMQSALRIVTPLLGNGGTRAKYRISWLAGESGQAPASHA